MYLIQSVLTLGDYIGPKKIIVIGLEGQIDALPWIAEGYCPVLLSGILVFGIQMVTV